MAKVGLTGNRDLDILILLQLEEVDFKKMCNINQYFMNICIDDDFWRLKIDKDFPGQNRVKPATLTYKEYYDQLLIPYAWDLDVANKINTHYNAMHYHIDDNYLLDVSSLDKTNGKGLRTIRSPLSFRSPKFQAKNITGLDIVSDNFDNYAYAIQALNGPTKLQPVYQNAIDQAKIHFRRQ